MLNETALYPNTGSLDLFIQEYYVVFLIVLR